ncbi:hypothetical protein BDV19DRAFT_390016 [Aspergillus venezuelensis]
MRTRSQPDSPGGFVSLDDMKNATRRTRTTRSASRAASQEPASQGSSSQQSSFEQSTETTTQPTTRAKTQRRTVKKATTKKTTTTASNSKPQTRTSKRGTRSSKRNAEEAATEEAPENTEEKPLGTARADNEKHTETDTENPESGPSTSDNALLEPKNSELSKAVPLEPGEVDRFDSISNTVDNIYDVVLQEEAALQQLYAQDANQPVIEVSFSSDPVGEEPTMEEVIRTSEDITRMLGKAENDLVTSRFIEQQAGHYTPEQLAARSPTTTDVGQPSASKSVSDTVLQMAALVPLPSDEDESDSSETCLATEEQATEEPERSMVEAATSNDNTESTEPITSLGSAVSFEKAPAVGHVDYDELVECFAKLTLSKNAPPEASAIADVPAVLPAAGQAISNHANQWHLASATSLPFAAYPMVSIYDSAPPIVPALFVTLTCRSTGPDKPPPSPVITEIPETAEKTLDAATSAGSRLELRRRPISRSQRRNQLREWPNTPLSPIAEEKVLGSVSSSNDEPGGADNLDELSAPASSIGRAIGCSPSSPVVAVASRSPSSPVPSRPNNASALCSGSSSSFQTIEAAVTVPSEIGSREPLMTSNSPKAPKSSKPIRTQRKPKITELQPTHKFTQQPKTKKKLTKKKVNRKRSRTEDSADDNAEPVTPYANKRRNLGPPGSTPFARHLTPLARRLSRTAPRSERMLRRRAESQGRIHSTIFRLPEFVAQTQADRVASETSSLTAPSEPLQTDLEPSSEQVQTDDETVAEQPDAAEEPSTPEPAKSGWNFGGIFSSVPRSFSRFLPRFGRTPVRSQDSSTRQAASERIQRTRPATAASEKETQSDRQTNEEPPAKRARNLSFSLYPAKIDRSLYLGDVPSKSFAPASTSASTTAPLLQSVEQRMPQTTVPETSTTSSEPKNVSTPRASKTASEAQKKRKRSPSPDVIPNPAGSSYGMDLDYFCYSSESDEDEATPVVPQTEPKKADVNGKSALRSVAQTERPADKKKKNVHFGLSPEDTPSKKRRARATDPYSGTHFIGMGGSQSAPTTPTPASRVQDPRQRPGFVPNSSGTFELDYDVISDDSESSGAPSPSSVPAPSPIPKTPTSAQPATPQSAQPSAPRSAARPTQTPTQTPSTPAKYDEEALARVRSRAEKYKPKTPSGLRTTSRYSSPLANPTPDATPTLKSTAAAEKIAEEFGDDHFAQEAQWLFENCPSGDLTQLKWPEPRPFGEGLNASAESIRIVNEIWDPADVDKAYAVFQRELAEYKESANETVA